MLEQDGRRREEIIKDERGQEETTKDNNEQYSIPLSTPPLDLQFLQK